MATGKISTSLVVAYVASILTLVALAALALFGLQAARVEIENVSRSLRQLETARTIEAAFNGYFLELARSPDAGLHSMAAGRVRGTLLVQRGIINEAIAQAPDEDSRAVERGDLIRALRLTTLFQDMERKTLVAAAERGTPAQLAAILELDELAFRQILTRIIEEERVEAAAAFARLEDLRRRVFTVATVLMLAYLIGALALGATAYRRVLRPIQALGQTVEGFPAVSGMRAPSHLPGEFALLADRFNGMLDRIETEQDRLQREVARRTRDLGKANAELRRIDQARRAFFANISHELRTPITVLLGEAQIALRGSGTEREALTRISASGGFLRRRLDDLLSLARSEDGTLALERGPVDLAGATEAAVAAARAFAEANEARLELEVDGTRTVEGDASALRQAVLALIDNAVKFSPPGGRIFVRVGPDGVSVGDEGAGFGPGDPMALFDRYAQGGEGRHRGGSGLGLAIVKWIADHHGARLSASDRPEGGAQVRLTWPA